MKIYIHVQILLLFVLLTLVLCPALFGEASRTSLIRDLSRIEGIRDNSLIGYGMVVGLNGTGDKRQTLFTTQTLSNMLQKMGIQASANSIRVNNVASVFVTASLPPFMRPGSRVDVTVSSIGDAKSLEGGLLVMTPLRGADGQAYVTAQGPLVLGGYAAAGGGTSKQMNHPTVGRIPEGGIVERGLELELTKLSPITLVLQDESFTTAQAIATTINHDFQSALAVALDGRRIELRLPKEEREPASILARVEMLAVPQIARPKVVVNERTGTVVLGKEVRLGALSILHGTLTIEVKNQLDVSQPGPLSNGQTVVVPNKAVRVQEGKSRRIELVEGATVEDLVSGLQEIGATARDVISILQAIKAAGALEAELEVI